MKNYIYSDEEVFSEEEEESVEIVNQQKIKKKKKKEIVKSKDCFDEDNFDKNVAKSITKIHKKKDPFSKWVNENIEDLQKLYNFSDLSCNEADFYYYIYENTYKESKYIKNG